MHFVIKTLVLIEVLMFDLNSLQRSCSRKIGEKNVTINNQIISINKYAKNECVIQNSKNASSFPWSTICSVLKFRTL